MRYSEFDEDRMVSVRASVLQDGERRIVELEELHLADEQSVINMQRRIAELEADLAKMKDDYDISRKALITANVKAMSADLQYKIGLDQTKYIVELQSENSRLEAELAAIKSTPVDDQTSQYEAYMEQRTGGLIIENHRLRECLKRLEWIHGDFRIYCPACNGVEEHSNKCWLAAELKEGK